MNNLIEEGYVKGIVIETYTSQSGGSYWNVRCLGCKILNKVYIWSYNGCGKKCDGCRKKLYLGGRGMDD